MWGTVTTKVGSASGNPDDGGFGKNRFDQSGGGGGFLNSTISSPSTSEKKKPERFNNVLPCTIAQIHLMAESDESLKVGTLSAKMVTFVGVVQTVDVQTTKITYLIDDYTGPGIEVQLWIGEEIDHSRLNIVQESTYARVTGGVRSMKGKRHVICYNIQSIKDVNEITMHIAEVVHSSMAIAVMDKQSSAAAASTAGFGSSSMLTSGANSSTDTFDFSNSRKLSKPQQLVKQAIISCKEEQGLAVQELYNTLKSISRPSIQEALDFLSNEGHIYSTVDEDHYKATDCV